MHINFDELVIAANAEGRPANLLGLPPSFDVRPGNREDCLLAAEEPRLRNMSAPASITTSVFADPRTLGWSGCPPAY